MRIFTWRQRIIVFTTTLGVIGVFGLVGYGLDQAFDTGPVLLVASIILSFPVTQVILAKRMRKHVKKHPWNANDK